MCSCSTWESSQFAFCSVTNYCQEWAKPNSKLDHYILLKIFSWIAEATYGWFFLSCVWHQRNQKGWLLSFFTHWHFVSNCQQNSWGRSPVCHILLIIEVALWTGKWDLPFQKLILCLLSSCWGQNCSATAFSVSLEMRSLFQTLQQHFIKVTQSQGIKANSFTGCIINSFFEAKIFLLDTFYVSEHFC